MQLEIPVVATEDPPVFRSRFGGLWIDRSDAHGILARRLASGRVTEADAEILAHYIDHGYVILPRATDVDLIDDYVAFFEEAFSERPPVSAHSKGSIVPISPDLYDKVAKVSCLHAYYPRAADLIFPPAVLRFMTQIYDRPPVAFQTMSMRKGSEEPLHIDTGPLTLTEPMTMAASWVALEDVQPRSGEFEFVPGSHRVTEVLHHGVGKGHDGDMIEYGRILANVHEQCAERGLKTERFMAKKGDVLIWHADLMHGGAVIEDESRTRKSLVAHFMPLGVMPTFYDFSDVHAVPYPNGGYCLDNVDPSRRTRRPPAGEQPTGQGAAASAQRSPEATDPIQRVKKLVPLGAKQFARAQLDWLAKNPTLKARSGTRAGRH